MVCGPVSYTLTISSDGIIMMVNITDTYYHFTGLTPKTDYTISVQPSNSAGSGQSYTDTIRTASNSECYYLCELVFVSCVLFTERSVVHNNAINQQNINILATFLWH